MHVHIHLEILATTIVRKGPIDSESENAIASVLDASSH